MTPREFFDRIDYQQLVFQKEILLRDTGQSVEELAELADGLLHLVDSLQDCAAELYGEEKVFLFEKKAEYMLKYRNYCNDNGLFDDSKSLSTREIFEFVDDIIIPGEDEEQGAIIIQHPASVGKINSRRMKPAADNKLINKQKR